MHCKIFRSRAILGQTIKEKINSDAFRLLLCGLSALYWELALIRWLSVSIRIIAYYSNFILISAFFGLGVGALMARFQIRLHRLIFPAVVTSVLLGIYLSGFFHLNIGSADEFVWIGSPPGVLPSKDATPTFSSALPPGLILVMVYFASASVFVIFGQWIGNLFKLLSPLWAYSVEIFGSILGIILFAVMSLLQCSPTIWFAVGFILLFIILERKFVDFILAFLLSVVVLLYVSHFDDQFVWSPYYRIHVENITKIFDKNSKDYIEFKEPIGYQLTVNSDYHQMLLDLRARSKEHSFLRSWRAIYDYPYRDIENLPQGAILIVGAGTGNDVSAALRNTDRTVFAVEIDPVIMQIGQQLHFEKPYSNSRVTKVVDDARSFFQKTNEKFALVVFGFLDSHTLLSSYSSVRLDNFVYTRESFNQVKQILLPGGKVYVTFASNEVWIHERLISLLNEIFDYQTVATRDDLGYANGFVYANGKISQTLRQPDKRNKPDLSVNVPRDNWPFLYLRKPTIPKHYIFLICFIMIYGLASLLLLPKGQRRLRLPYFFLGAAFFLIETSNVISLSLLFGSTWYVNIVVFTGILTLVLMGNLTSYLINKPRIKVYFCLLTLCILVAFVVPTYWLLAIDSSFQRGFTAIAVFLGPVYFASLIFATLIKEEKNLFQAYGSNVLGAVVGGACEYLSLIFGFKFLVILTLVFYFAAYTMIRKTDTVHY